MFVTIQVLKQQLETNIYHCKRKTKQTVRRFKNTKKQLQQQHRNTVIVRHYEQIRHSKKNQVTTETKHNTKQKTK